MFYKFFDNHLLVISISFQHSFLLRFSHLTQLFFSQWLWYSTFRWDRDMCTMTGHKKHVSQTQPVDPIRIQLNVSMVGGICF